MLEEKVEVWDKAGEVGRCLLKGKLTVGPGPTPCLCLSEAIMSDYQFYSPHNLPYMWYLVGENGVDGPLLKCWNLMQKTHTMLATAIRVEEAYSVSTKNKVSCKETI